MCLFSYKIEFSKKMKFTKLRARTELRTYYEEFLRARTYPYVIGIPIQYDIAFDLERATPREGPPERSSAVTINNFY